MNEQTAKTYVHQALSSAGNDNDNKFSPKTNRAIVLFRESVRKRADATLTELTLQKLMPALSDEEMSDYVAATTAIEDAEGKAIDYVSDKLY